MGFGGLYTSVSGMQSSKISLDTVSHNIANTANPHYVRQSAIHKDNFYQNVKYGQVTTSQVGKGAGVSHIRQIRDDFLDKQLRRELPALGYNSVKADALTDVEAVFNEISASGLQNVLDDFWNSWQELYKYPESLTNREMVNESGVAFVDTVQRIGKQLKDIQNNIDVELAEKGRETNTVLKEIGRLNREIRLAESEGALKTHNDKRDERNALLDRISQLLPVNLEEDIHGEVIVTLNGRSLVEGGYVQEIDLVPNKDSNSGHLLVYWQNSDVEIDLKGKGELGALIDVRDKSIVAYRDRLDVLVRDVAESVNEIHKSGYGLDFDPENPDAYEHINFFVSQDPLYKEGEELNLSATNIKLHPDIMNLNKIAISGAGDPGDGELAKAIYALRDKPIILVDEHNTNGLELSKDDYYRRIITDVGLERQEALNNLQSQMFLVKSIDENRAALSTVSLDEEMSDLVRFQYSYMANSRVFNAIDEMIDVVVNRVGIVGR